MTKQRRVTELFTTGETVCLTEEETIAVLRSIESLPLCISNSVPSPRVKTLKNGFKIIWDSMKKGTNLIEKKVIKVINVCPEQGKWSAIFIERKGISYSTRIERFNGSSSEYKCQSLGHAYRTMKALAAKLNNDTSIIVSLHNVILSGVPVPCGLDLDGDKDCCAKGTSRHCVRCLLNK